MLFEDLSSIFIVFYHGARRGVFVIFLRNSFHYPFSNIAFGVSTYKGHRSFHFMFRGSCVEYHSEIHLLPIELSLCALSLRSEKSVLTVSCFFFSHSRPKHGVTLFLFLWTKPIRAICSSSCAGFPYFKLIGRPCCLTLRKDTWPRIY